MRTERREALLVLLTRAEHGVLTPPEAARLRALIEAELTDADKARRAARGHQAAARRGQRRLAAAEEAIREVEADRDHLAREGFDERRRHRAEVVEAHGLVEQAEARAARAEQQLVDAEALTTRYAGYLVAARDACGAPDWPSLPDTIRAIWRLADRGAPVGQHASADH